MAELAPMDMPSSQTKIMPSPHQSTGTQLLSYMRSAGLGSVIMGSAALIPGPEYFWFFAGFVNLGLIIFGIDVFFERWEKRWLRWCCVFVVVAVAGAFNWFSFADYRLEFDSVTEAADVEHQPGTSIAGIPWRPEFTKLEVIIRNPTTSNYSDLDLIIRPDMAVAKIAQLTDIQGLSLEDKYGVKTTIVQGEVQGQGHRQTEIPLVLHATNAGYRVRCEKLPGKTGIRLILAVVGIRQPRRSLVIGERFTEKNVIIQEFGYGTNYWFGLPGAEHYTSRQIPKGILIDGSFTAGQRRRSLETQITPSYFGVLVRRQ
ncbi:MAG: hypothetical protein ACREJN_11710 [Nitrospiraceae bacterium]